MHSVLLRIFVKVLLWKCKTEELARHWSRIKEPFAYGPLFQMTEELRFDSQQG
jgi:hypothetical protein